MKDWKDYTTEDAILVIEKAISHQAWTINSCQRNCLDVVRDFTGFTAEPIKEIIKATVEMTKKEKVG